MSFAAFLFLFCEVLLVLGEFVEASGGCQSGGGREVSAMGEWTMQAGSASPVKAVCGNHQSTLPDSSIQPHLPGLSHMRCG